MEVVVTPLKMEDFPMETVVFPLAMEVFPTARAVLPSVMLVLPIGAGDSQPRCRLLACTPHSSPSVGARRVSM